MAMLKSALKSAITSLGAAASLCVAVAEGRASDLSGQQIKGLVAGATVEIDTPASTKLPVRYDRDGKLHGRAGGLAWYLGSDSDTGKWWIASDQLCHKWRHWFDQATHCMRLSKEGRIIRWHSTDGFDGTATITVPAPVEIAAAAAPPVQRRPIAVTSAEAAVAPPKAAATEITKPAGMVQPAQQAAEAAPPQQVVPPRPVPAERTAATSPPPRPQAAEPKRPDQPVYKVTNVRSDDVLNVRAGPSEDFDIVGALLPGTRGIAITAECQSRWCPVQHSAATGWVNSAYLVPEDAAPGSAWRDAPDAPRACLSRAAHALLDRIERAFGPVRVISTCRPGAMIPGAGLPSRHASGNAVDFLAGSRKAAIVAWLIAHHHTGGTMTYADMDHIHVDIGPPFVSIAGGPHWASWREGRRGD
jgi:hypothetical protein